MALLKSPAPLLSPDDIHWITNNLNTESEPVISGSVSGGCRIGVKKELNFSKRKVNSILASFSYRSSCQKIARKLQKLFKNCNTEKGDHWLYIAQNYTP